MITKSYLVSRWIKDTKMRYATDIFQYRACTILDQGRLFLSKQVKCKHEQRKQSRGVLI